MGVPCRKAFPAPSLVDGLEPAVPSGMQPAETDELRELARGRSVLEVGSAWGYSTIVMARVARSVVSVDPHVILDTEAAFVSNLAAHGVAERVRYYVKTSREALPYMHAMGWRFELVFIDGDHNEAEVRFDATWARALVTPHGVICFHDYVPDVRLTVTDGLASWSPPDRLIESLAVFTGPWAG